jgi:hypothetical protein
MTKKGLMKVYNSIKQFTLLLPHLNFKKKILLQTPKLKYITANAKHEPTKYLRRRIFSSFFKSHIKAYQKCIPCSPGVGHQQNSLQHWKKPYKDGKLTPSNII